MRRTKSSTFWGYIAGIVTGVTYGMNPLFGKPLLSSGVSVDTMLFFRYIIAVALLGGWLLYKGIGIRVSGKQFFILSLMGIMMGFSGVFLFQAYKFMPSGQATTIIYLYPVMVALIMILLKVYPKWQVWLSILLTFVGVLILCLPDGDVVFNWKGIILSFLSALAFAFYIVLNRNRSVKELSSNVLTFYVLVVGTVFFFAHHLIDGGDFMAGVSGLRVWGNMVGLAIFPTIISMVSLAVSIRLLGATKTSVLGVFEPLTAIFIGLMVFGEPLTLNIIVGMMICISAIVFMAISTSKK